MSFLRTPTLPPMPLHGGYFSLAEGFKAQTPSPMPSRPIRLARDLDTLPKSVRRVDLVARLLRQG